MRSSVWQAAATSIWERMTTRWWKIDDWYLRSQEVTPPSPPDPDPAPTPDPDPTPDPIPAYQPVLNAKVGGYLNNLRAANQAFVMERRDHAGGDGPTLNLRVICGCYHYTAAGQLAKSMKTLLRCSLAVTCLGGAGARMASGCLGLLVATAITRATAARV